MKICILSSFGDLMSRDTGPSVRIYNLAKHLVGIGHKVHIVIPSSENWSKRVDGIFVHAISGFCPVGCLRVFSRLLGVLRHTSFLFYDFLFILRTTRTILRCDLVQIEQTSAGGFIIPLLTKVFGKPLVVDCHDAFQALRIGHTGIVRKALETFLEKMAYKFANVVLAVSENEKNFLASYGVKQDMIKVIPNGVDTGVFRPLSDKIHVRNRCYSKNSVTIIFVGNMEYLPNQEAVHVIATKLAPKIQSKINNVKFIIVGRNPPKLESSNLIFTGVVKNIKKFLADSDVAIAPLFHGSGTKLKILEYFASGLPVVSTTIGVEGLEVKNGVDALIADDMNEFAIKVTELITDKVLAMKLGKAARELVLKKYDWEEISSQLDTVYCDVISATQRNAN